MSLLIASACTQWQTQPTHTTATARVTPRSIFRRWWIGWFFFFLAQHWWGFLRGWGWVEGVSCAPRFWSVLLSPGHFIVSLFCWSGRRSHRRRFFPLSYSSGDSRPLLLSLRDLSTNLCVRPPPNPLPRDPASRRLAHASFRLTAVTYSKLFPPCWSIIRGIVFYLKLRVRTLLTHSLEGDAFESDWKEEHEDFMCRCQASWGVHASIKKRKEKKRLERRKSVWFFFLFYYIDLRKQFCQTWSKNCTNYTLE